MLLRVAPPAKLVVLGAGAAWTVLAVPAWTVPDVELIELLLRVLSPAKLVVEGAGAAWTLLPVSDGDSNFKCKSLRF